MNTKAQTLKKAPLYRQLFAMFYDSLLIISMLFIVTAILIAFHGGEAITTQDSPAFPVFLLMLIFIFYSWFWTKSGQTLGMKVWKIKVIQDNGYLLGWQHSFLRLFFALLSLTAFGLGYLWNIVFGYTWHDKLSQTSVIDLREPK